MEGRGVPAPLKIMERQAGRKAGRKVGRQRLSSNSSTRLGLDSVLTWMTNSGKGCLHYVQPGRVAYWRSTEPTHSETILSAGLGTGATGATGAASVV
jgi:hypothetical protein